jgi:hypothetical protein
MELKKPKPFNFKKYRRIVLDTYEEFLSSSTTSCTQAYYFTRNRGVRPINMTNGEWDSNIYVNLCVLNLDVTNKIQCLKQINDVMNKEDFYQWGNNV